MAFKGKYPGPDRFKGNKKKIAAWKASKKKSPAKPKVNKYEKQADELAKKQFAGSLKELEMGRETNTRNYTQQKTDRATALSNELASNKTAGAITTNTISGLRGQALAQFAKDTATQKALSDARTGVENAVNTDALTQYQEQMKARGIDPAQAEIMTSALKTQQGYGQELDSIRNNAAVSSEQLARQMYDMAGINAQGQQNRTAAQAENAANKDQTAAYAAYSGKDAELAGALAKTRLDQGSTAANTALTLRKEAALRKQEKAQLRLERHVAGLKNAEAMAKVASSDYFKEADLKLKQADMKLKGKELDARIEKYRRDGDTAEARLLETMRNNLAKQRSADAKAGISYGRSTTTGGKNRNGAPLGGSADSRLR